MQAIEFETQNGVTTLIKLSSCCPWASETSGSKAAKFNFPGDVRDWDNQSNAFYDRALPVRSGK